MLKTAHTTIENLVPLRKVKERESEVGVVPQKAKEKGRKDVAEAEALVERVRETKRLVGTSRTERANMVTSAKTNIRSRQHQRR